MPIYLLLALIGMDQLDNISKKDISKMTCPRKKGNASLLRHNPTPYKTTFYTS
jgi:hypothetical protein